MISFFEHPKAIELATGAFGYLLECQVLFSPDVPRDDAFKIGDIISPEEP